MIQIEEYAKMMKNEHEIMLKQTDGLSHADSLIQPQPGGNCLNWVVGYGSEPITGEATDVLPFEALVEHYGLLNEAICARLEKMTEAQFEDEIELWQGRKTRGWAAFFFFFHNTYHLGQLEQLRNLAGRTEKII
jgi:hypothetical protein